jgi:hypothetical protein
LNCSCPHCSLITLSTLSESFSGLSWSALEKYSETFLYILSPV